MEDAITTRAKVLSECPPPHLEEITLDHLIEFVVQLLQKEIDEIDTNLKEALSKMPVVERLGIPTRTDFTAPAKFTAKEKLFAALFLQDTLKQVPWFVEAIRNNIKADTRHLSGMVTAWLMHAALFDYSIQEIFENKYLLEYDEQLDMIASVTIPGDQ